MPTFDIMKEVKPKKSFRIASVIGQFDLQSEHIQEKFKGEIKLNKDWQIGIIYGHSGTGKTTIAKELFSDNYIKQFDYNAESILDDMPKEKSVKEITMTFNSVGFSSPPSWLKPYSVLSTGERMRVDLARAILEKSDLIVFDEFTSVVDRNVAKIGSAAISKAIKRTDKKFIAVTCHEDIIEWLEPDWTFNTNNMIFDYTRGRLRRPKIKIQIFKERRKWQLFKKYHYLNTNLNKSAQQFVMYYNNQPIAFLAYIHFPHHKVKNAKKGHRLVVLPDFQGIGIGIKFVEYIIQSQIIDKGFRFFSTTSNPAFIKQHQSSKKWRLIKVGRNKYVKNYKSGLHKTLSRKRIVTSWEYIG